MDRDIHLIKNLHANRFIYFVTILLFSSLAIGDTRIYELNPSTQLKRALTFFELASRIKGDKEIGRIRESLTLFKNALASIDSSESEDESSGNSNWGVQAGELPYEKSAAYFYIGMCYYRLGEFDKAKESFRLSLDADADTITSVPQEKVDFNVSRLMLSLSSLKLGDESTFKKQIEALSLETDNLRLIPVEQLKSSFYIIVAVGDGPFVNHGSRGSTLYIDNGPVPENRVDVYIDNELVGSSLEIMDLNFQAKSMESVGDEEGRVSEDIAKTALALFFGGQLDPVRASASSWRGLPAKYFFFSHGLTGNPVSIQIKIYDKDGEYLDKRSAKLTLSNMQVGSGDILYFRSKM